MRLSFESNWTFVDVSGLITKRSSFISLSLNLRYVGTNVWVIDSGQDFSLLFFRMCKCKYWESYINRSVNPGLPHLSLSRSSICVLLSYWPPGWREQGFSSEGGSRSSLWGTGWKEYSTQAHLAKVKCIYTEIHAEKTNVCTVFCWFSFVIEGIMGDWWLNWWHNDKKWIGSIK